MSDNKLAVFDQTDRENNTYTCNRCGYIVRLEADGPYENGMDYCPHCGRLVVHLEDVEEMLG